MVTAAGGAALVGGIMSLAVVSPAESRYAGILGIADPGAEGSGLRRSPDEAGQEGEALEDVPDRPLRRPGARRRRLVRIGRSGRQPDHGGMRRGAGAPQRARQEPGREGLRVLPGRESERAGARAHPGRGTARQLPGRPVPGFLAPHPPEDEEHTLGSLRR
ncbi:MAG: hypothetical protein M0C28_13780 [Candidatus Moduliflexus flocculans]|nr:hypothetical protein [Candidatus Moduliflexus flocculans]